MTKSKSRKPDVSNHARAKPKHRKNRMSGTRKTASRKVVRRRPAASSSVAIAGKSQPYTKQAQVIEVLCAPSGATIEALMQVTGWQQHSVRGFLAAIVRKKLCLDLRSKIIDGGRVYRVVDGAPSFAVDTRTKTAA